MIKKLTSIILSVSIVASLFVGLNFSALAAATDAKGNTVKTGSIGTWHTLFSDGYKSVDVLAAQGVDPTKSLIKNTADADAKVYYYINSAEANPELARFTDLTFGARTETPGVGIENFTGVQEYDFGDAGVKYTINDTTKNPSRPIVGPESLTRYMFVDLENDTNAASAVNAVVDDESRQYIQINFKLDAEATITDFVTTGTINSGLPSQARKNQSYKHFKVFVGDTEEDLFNADNCVSEVNNDAAVGYLAVSLAEPATGSWVGLRIICPYVNTNWNNDSGVNTGATRWMTSAHFGVHGTYVNPINTEGLGVTVEAEGDLPESLVKKSDPVYGKVDKNGKYGICNVIIDAEKTYADIENSAMYNFEGWYNGDQKVSGDTQYAYNLGLGSANFTAKYTRTELDSNDIPVIPEFVNKYKGKLNTKENLMQEGYTYGRTDHKDWLNLGTITYRSFNATGTSGSLGKPRDSQGTLDIIDGNLDTYSEMLNPKFYDSNHQYIEGEFVDIVVTLLHPTKLDALFVGLQTDEVYRASKYSVYIRNGGHPYNLMPNEKTGENAATNRVFEFENKNNDQCQVFEFPEGTVATHIGIRIYDPVAKGRAEDVEPGWSWARLSEIGVFGEYNVDHYDYTFTSSTGNLVNESGKAYSGQKMSFEAPLTKNGFSFVNFTVNGEKADAVIDKSNNTATIDTIVNAKTDIVANYEKDPTTLTSDKYGVYDNYVSVEKGDIAFEVTTGFDQYKNNVVVKSNSTALSDHDFVTSGMKVELSANGTVANTYEVVYKGDFNGDNAITVTDIVNARKVMLNDANATDLEKFRFDANADKELTVTDIVSVVETIVNEQSAADYSKKTVTANNLQFKEIGRTEIVQNTRLLFKHAASGFAITADCYGDVVFRMQGGQFEYLTVVVDGVERELCTNYISSYDYVVAEDLEPGIHTIEVYRQESQMSHTYLNSVTINGEILSAPKDKELLIEFIGDSLTCGVGDNVLTKEEQLGAHTDVATKAYGRLTAMALDADWSNIAVGGSTVANVSGSSMVMPQNYLVTHLNGSTWDFENKRQADIVVINLGTNEWLLTESNPSGLADMKVAFENALYDFTKQIIALNSKKDVKVVYAYGMMTDEDNWVNTCYANVIARLKAEGITVPYCQLPQNNDGGANHTSTPGHAAAAEVLAEFIKTNVLDS